jgi:hypothetical protein
MGGKYKKAVNAKTQLNWLGCVTQTVEFCVNEPHASNVRRLLIITAVFRIKLVKLL